MWWKKKKETLFEEVYTQYKNYVFLTAYRLTHDNEKAMEISQEVFLKVYQSDLTKVENIGGWLRKVTYNTAINYLKKWTKVVELHDSYGKDEEGFLGVETKDMFLRLLERLNPGERAVLVLRVKEDRSYQEIADILEIPIGTVMSRLNSGRKKIAKFLQEDEVIENG